MYSLVVVLSHFFQEGYLGHISMEHYFVGKASVFYQWNISAPTPKLISQQIKGSAACCYFFLTASRKGTRDASTVSRRDLQNKI